MTRRDLSRSATLRVISREPNSSDIDQPQKLDRRTEDVEEKNESET
jgi:hypothetical protein